MTRKHPAHVITNDSVTGSAEIERSLKFHDGDSAYLSRTPGSAGNRKTFTFSCWFKRATLGTQSGVGQCFELTIVKKAASTHKFTLTAGSGVTIVGEPDVTADSSGTFIFRVTSSTAVSAFRK